MAQKKTLRKKKRIRRPGRLLLLVLALAAALGLILFLVLRPADEPTAQVSPAGDGLWDGSWYEDDLGRIEKDKALVKGMAAFEKKTGVRPFLTLLNGIDPEELYVFVQDQYEALFSEGDHLLVVYDEWGSDEYFLSAQAGAGSALSAEDV